MMQKTLHSISGVWWHAPPQNELPSDWFTAEVVEEHHPGINFYWIMCIIWGNCYLMV